MRRQGFLFGLDTLALNLPLLHARAIAEVLRVQRISVAPEAIVADHPDRSSKFIFETLVGKAGKRHCVPDPSVLWAEKWRQMATLPEDDVLLNQGTIAFIRRMHAMHVPLAIVSAAPREFIEFVLRASGVRSCFCVIVSVYDADIGEPKTAPDVFLKTAKLLRLRPEDCIAIERRESGMIGAKAAGMRCVALVKDPASVHVPVDWIVPDLRAWSPSTMLAA